MSNPRITANYLVLGNWKMNLDQQGALSLAKHVASQAASHVQVGVCPAFPHLIPVSDAIGGSALLLGAQDCHANTEGAFTGSVSGPMLVDAGCSFTLIGHSERRVGLGERDADVRQKATSAVALGLHAVICVGELLAERDGGNYKTRLADQLLASLPESTSRETVSIAYEPIWAIGTGRAASASDIAEAHTHLKAILRDTLNDDALPRILYGGSVKANNALEILSLPVVDGVLVGGASLDPSQFAGIIQAASQAALKKV